MNRYKLSKAGIDVNDGVRRVGNDKEAYEKFLYSFPEDDNYIKMLAAIEQRDPQAAFQASHALKGVAGNLSLVNLHAALLPLVEVFRKNTMEGAENYLPEVKECYEIVIRALSE